MEKSNTEKIEDMNLAISKKRSALAKAFLEDEAVRMASINRSKAYIDKIEEEDSRMKPWIWNLLYFILGMLFAFSVPSFGQIFYEILNNLGG